MTEENNRTLMQRMYALNGLLHRYLRMRRGKGGPFGDPHRGQARVLALLRLKPEISQRELGYLLDIRPQSLGELLGKLEKSGYIARTPSAEDRRVMRVTLTEAGEAAARETGERQPEADMAFAALTEEEQAKLAALLDKVIAALRDEVGNEQGPMEGQPFEPGRGQFHRGGYGAHPGGGPRGHGPQGHCPHGMRPGMGWQPEDGWPGWMENDDEEAAPQA